MIARLTDNALDTKSSWPPQQTATPMSPGRMKNERRNRSHEGLIQESLTRSGYPMVGPEMLGRCRCDW